MSNKENTQLEKVTSEDVDKTSVEVVKENLKSKFSDKKDLIKKAAVLTGVGVAGFLLGRYLRNNSADLDDCDDEYVDSNE